MFGAERVCVRVGGGGGAAGVEGAGREEVELEVGDGAVDGGPHVRFEGQPGGVGHVQAVRGEPVEPGVGGGVGAPEGRGVEAGVTGGKVRFGAVVVRWEWWLFVFVFVCGGGGGGVVEIEDCDGGRGAVVGLCFCVRRGRGLVVVV